jgi:hypothetical protein
MALKATGTRTRKKAAVEEVPALPELEPEMIARRAYELYEAGEGGDSLDHWLRAEQELVGDRAAA